MGHLFAESTLSGIFERLEEWPTSARYEPFITAFIHERNQLGRMDTEEGTNDGLRPEQKEILDGLVRRFFVDGERCLLVEAPTGVGKTRIALEFVRELWRRRGRCRVLVVVPRRVLAYNPWKKEIGRWMSDLEPKCLILSGFMPPRERVLALSSFRGTSCS
jgi:superfamily II DNA or RNA helicase